MEDTQNLGAAPDAPVDAAPAAADDGGAEEAYSLPPVFDLEATKQAAYEAAMAEGGDEGDGEGDGNDGEQPASKPAPAEPAAPADPLSKLTPEEQAAARAALASEVEASAARVRELEAKAQEQTEAQRRLREQYDQWLAIDQAVQSEHDELKALVYSSDPDKWTNLQKKGHDLESAIARVAELEGRIGERNERRTMAAAINRDAHQTAWSALDQALRAQTKHEGITNEVLEAGGDLNELLDRSIGAAVKAARAAEAAEWKGKLDEQKALYERRMTRAGGESSAVIEQGGRSGDPSTAFLASVMKNGRLVPGAIERAMRGDFESVPLGT